MKQNHIVLTTLLLGLSMSAEAGRFIPSEFESYDTQDLHKISFVNDDIVAEWTDGQTNAYAFSSLQRILFSEATQTEAEKQMAETQTGLFLYPNPVVETLYLSGVPSGTEVYLYTSNGTVVGSMLCTGSTLSANVSHLKSGIYFLKIADKAVKFIKK